MNPCPMWQRSYNISPVGKVLTHCLCYENPNPQSKLEVYANLLGTLLDVALIEVDYVDPAEQNQQVTPMADPRV